MKVNGSLILVEGGVIENLTLPSGAVFPDNGNLGELFSLSATQLENMADGFYHHDGTDWRNLPTLAEVQAMLDAIEIPGGSTPFTSFKALHNARTMITSALAAGDYWALDGAAVILTTTGVGTVVLPLMHYDPADYATGTKFRLSVNVNQNAVAGSATNTISVGLNKVLRPATGGGGTNVVVYDASPTDVVNVQFTEPAIKASFNLVSAEVEMPTEAGFYAFHINTTGANPTSASTHIDITLQAKY